MNNSSIVTTTFCRKCFKLRSCLSTKNSSNYSFLCKECARANDLVIECINCGRESLVNDLDKGLCIYCKCDSLETEIKKLKKRKKVYS